MQILEEAQKYTTFLLYTPGFAPHLSYLGSMRQLMYL